MTAHLIPAHPWIIPGNRWVWSECVPGEQCRSIAHLDEPAELLNSYPEEWTMEMLGGNCSTNDTFFFWLDADGENHAVGGPARMSFDGHLFWLQHGIYHRADGPAVEWDNGSESWWLNGKQHRQDGPSKLSPHEEKWYVDGKLHRVDGPAETDKLHQTWCRNGEYHRDGGKPAIVWADGRKEWFVDGQKVPASRNKFVAFLKTRWMLSEVMLRKITKTRVPTVKLGYSTVDEMKKKYPHKDVS